MKRTKINGIYLIYDLGGFKINFKIFTNFLKNNDSPL